MLEMATILSGFALGTHSGPHTGTTLMRAIMTGQLPLQTEAITDSYSIFNYLAAAPLKLPAEKGTYYHLAFLREKLASRFLRSYTWVDTRDMVADGLTKGTIDRTAIAAIMDGSYAIKHEAHEYIEPSAKPSSSSSNDNNNFYNAAGAYPSIENYRIAEDPRHIDFDQVDRD